MCALDMLDDRSSGKINQNGSKLTLSHMPHPMRLGWGTVAVHVQSEVEGHVHVFHNRWRQQVKDICDVSARCSPMTVSYTHLTLPTKLEV